MHIAGLSNAHGGEYNSPQVSSVKRARFEQLVWEAVESLPQFFKERLHNVMIVVQDYPDPEVQKELGDDLLGLYQGVPLPERSVFAEHPQPDIISIFQKNIEAYAGANEAEIRRQIRITVIHELGHYFGLDEDQLEILEGAPPAPPPSDP